MNIFLKFTYISGAPSNLGSSLGRWCGRTLRVIKTMSTSVTLRFSTNSLYTGRGFVIEYSLIRVGRLHCFFFSYFTSFLFLDTHAVVVNLKRFLIDILLMTRNLHKLQQDIYVDINATENIINTIHMSELLLIYFIFIFVKHICE